MRVSRFVFWQGRQQKRRKTRHDKDLWHERLESREVNTASSDMVFQSLAANQNLVDYRVYPNPSGMPYSSVADIPAGTMAPIQGSTKSFSLEGLQTTGENFAAVFEAVITVTEAGRYQFEVTSDDGSELAVGRKLDETAPNATRASEYQVVVSNDGDHGIQAQVGAVDLVSGYYPIRLTYFQNFGGAFLGVNYSGPQKLTITDASPQSEVAIEVVSLLDGVNAVRYELVSGSFWSTSEVLGHPPILTGTMDGFSVAMPDRPTDLFGVRYESIAHVTTDGLYTFSAKSDDGMHLSVDGRAIIKLDGEHPTWTSDGSVFLTAGSHKIDAVYFDRYGGETLEVWVRGPGAVALETFGLINEFRASPASVVGPSATFYRRGGDLVIEADSAGNIFQITLDASSKGVLASSNSVFVDKQTGTATTTLFLAGFNAIEIHLGAGNDSLEFVGDSRNPRIVPIFSVFGDEGDDTFTFKNASFSELKIDGGAGVDSLHTRGVVADYGELLGGRNPKRRRDRITLVESAFKTGVTIRGW